MLMPDDLVMREAIEATRRYHQVHETGETDMEVERQSLTA